MPQTLSRTDRLHDKAAEACVLSSMVQDPRCIPGVLPLLEGKAFACAEHQTIFETILAVWHRDGFALDGVLVRSELNSLGLLEGIGGADYLRAMMETTPTAANAVYYAKRVAERRRYRELVTAHDEIGQVLADRLEVGEQIRKVQQIALGLEPPDGENSVYDVRKHATRVAVATQDRVSFIPTGLRNLDRHIGGLVPGRFTIIAGRPGMGKSSLAVAFALNLARVGKRVLFFTLEMVADELIERMISVLSGVNLLAVKQEKADKALLDRFYQASMDLEKLPIVIEENRDTSENQIAAIRHQAKTGGVDLAVIDYLGLMTTGQRRVENRVQEVSTISRQLKLAAVREHIPIVAVSQLNRALEGRENHRPRLADLRDSGSLEQDADLVLLLHREDYYRRQANPYTTTLDGLTDCIIAKQRGGPCGVARLVFIEEATKFTDCATDDAIQECLSVES